MTSLPSLRSSLHPHRSVDVFPINNLIIVDEKKNPTPGVYDKLLAKGNENAAAAVSRAMERQMTKRYEKALEMTSKTRGKSEIRGKGKRIKEALENHIEDSSEE